MSLPLTTSWTCKLQGQEFHQMSPKVEVEGVINSFQVPSDDRSVKGIVIPRVYLRAREEEKKKREKLKINRTGSNPRTE